MKMTRLLRRADCHVGGADWMRLMASDTAPWNEVGIALGLRWFEEDMVGNLGVWRVRVRDLAGWKFGMEV